MPGYVRYTGINMHVQMCFLYKCICVRAVIVEIVPRALGSAVSAFRGLYTPRYGTVVALC